MNNISELGQVTKIHTNVEDNIRNFLKKEEGGIFVLESMNMDERDSWLHFIENE